MPSPNVEAVIGFAPYRVWNAGAPVGTPVVVTFSFATAQAGYDTEIRADFTAFSPVQQDHIRAAMAVWDASSGISFVEVAPDQGDMRFALIDMSDRTNSVGSPSSGFAYYPSTTGLFDGTDVVPGLAHDTIGGDVFLNVDLFSQDSSTAPGERGFSLLLHEIGHALGLQHSFEGDVAIDPAFDSGIYTVMSYNRSRQTTELGSIDLEAMRYLYGETDPDFAYDPTTDSFTVTSPASGGWSLGVWSGRNTLLGSASQDTLRGYSGDDTLSPGAGDDIAEGFDGDDLFIWTGGVDNFYGGTGDDMLQADLSGQPDGMVLSLDDPDFTSPDTPGPRLHDIEHILATGDTDLRLLGSWRDNSLTSDGGNDTLEGGIGDDTLHAGAGDDHLDGGRGTNILQGGAGQDSAYYDGTRATFSVTELGGPEDAVQITGFGLQDALSGIETVVFLDGSFSMTALRAGSFGPGRDLAGSAQADTLTGTAADDTLVAGAGSDVVRGGTGTDWILGGIGFDTLDGEDGNDTLEGADGYDTLSGQAGNDSLLGNNGFDRLLGGTGDDTLLGGLGIDTLLGGTGADLLGGQAGSDSLSGDDGQDTLNGNAGRDTLLGGTDADLLRGGINDDRLEGGDGDDTLYGGNGSDDLRGLSGDDRLEGNAGSDTLAGGNGNDVLRGGIGADVFFFYSFWGQDRIADFQNNIDTIVLDPSLFISSDPTEADIRALSSLTAEGDLMLTFHTGDSLTFSGVTNTTAILDDIYIA